MNRLGGSRPLLAAAVLGLIVAFAAGWALGRGDAPSSGSRRAAPATTSPSTGEPIQTGTGSGTPTDASVQSPTSSGIPDGASTPAPRRRTWRRAAVPDFTCPDPTDRVTTSEQLQQTLDQARPGDSILIEDGLYTGEFRTAREGTSTRPIYLCGSRDAILEAGAIKGGYTLHFDGATYWRADGFTVRNGQKGVMVDSGRGIALQNLLVEQIGDEAVHLRTHSSRNVVRGLTIRDTGLRKPQYGEGIYVGSAQSNWCEYTRCQPDRSNGNTIVDNRISQTPAEAVDLKEGTSGGVLRGNNFDGSAMTQADSWVDVKGNDWLVAGNTGVAAGADGYKVIEILDGWGWRNMFTANISRVEGGGYAINVTKRHNDNVVMCDNTVQEAGSGLTTIECTR